MERRVTDDQGFPGHRPTGNISVFGAGLTTLVQRLTLFLFFRRHLHGWRRSVVLKFVDVLPFPITIGIFVLSQHPALITPNITILAVRTYWIAVEVFEFLLHLLGGFATRGVRRVEFCSALRRAVHDRVGQHLTLQEQNGTKNGDGK